MPDAAPYDAFLLVSFGGPEGPDDVLPFLENVTRGRGIPAERLAEVGEHYHHFGGRSPINDQCRALLDAMREDFARHGLDLPIYWGNRNWHPFLRDTLQTMADDGVRRAVCLLTSAYPSYSGCRQYRENLYDAVQDLPGAPQLDRLRHYANHPGFVAPFVDGTREALRQLPTGSRVVFVTHSLPESMASASGPDGDAYVEQHRLVGAQIAAETGADWDLVYCSRSGPPHVPWLEPDINDHLRSLADQGVPGVAVVPIGFVSDHMEVRFDLDTEAAATAAEVGLPFVRVATPGTDSRFVAMARELVLERAAAERAENVPRATVADTEPMWDRCPPRCCPNPRADRPTLCGTADGPQPIRSQGALR